MESMDCKDAQLTTRTATRQGFMHRVQKVRRHSGEVKRTCERNKINVITRVELSPLTELMNLAF